MINIGTIAATVEILGAIALVIATPRKRSANGSR